MRVADASELGLRELCVADLYDNRTVQSNEVVCLRSIVLMLEMAAMALLSRCTFIVDGLKKATINLTGLWSTMAFVALGTDLSLSLTADSPLLTLLPIQYRTPRKIERRSRFAR